jgi:hypothetical protein
MKNFIELKKAGKNWNEIDIIKEYYELNEGIIFNNGAKLKKDFFYAGTIKNIYIENSIHIYDLMDFLYDDEEEEGKTLEESGYKEWFELAADVLEIPEYEKYKNSYYSDDKFIIDEFHSSMGG